MYKVILGAFIVIFIYGCASSHNDAQKNIRNLIVSGQFVKALEVLEKSDIKKDEKSKLLYLLEKGLIQHYLAKFSESLDTLEEAKRVSNELFTKSISQKITTAVTNDNYQDFYGAYYERSLIYFYQSLNHLMLSQNSEGNDKQKQLVAAKAEILLWDSLLKSFRDNRLGKSVYKDDMVSKIYGAKIHELLGGFNNEQIALQLYKDASDLLLKNYNAYKTYNQNFKEFKSDFEKLSEMNLIDVKQKYINPTKNQNSLKNFLSYKILSLTLKIRSNDKKNVIRQFEISDEMVKQVESDIKNKSDDNITVLVSNDLIPEKIGKPYNIGIDGAVNGISDKNTQKVIREVGIPIISMFAAQTLGLVPNAQNWSVPGAYLGITTAQIALSAWGIEFELPHVVNDKLNNELKLEVLNESGDKVIKEYPLVLIQPLNDLAEESVEEDSASNYLKTGSRVAGKHIVAIIAAYKTYQLLAKGGTMDFLARNAALLEYVAASKVIKATEKADSRYWSLLPKTISQIDIKLAEGKYRFKVSEINSSDDKVIRTFDLGVTEIKLNDKKIFNFRI